MQNVLSKPAECVNRATNQNYLRPVASIVALVADRLNFRSAEITGDSRHLPTMHARQMVYWLAHKRGISPSAIGRVVNKNHATVIAGARTFERKMARDPLLEQQALTLLTDLEASHDAR